MHVAKLSIQGNSLVGLYVVALENIVLVGMDVSEDEQKVIQEVFELPILQLSIAGTSLLGAFIATDGEKLVVPSIIFSDEEHKLLQAGVPFQKINTNNTCLGNNVIVTKKGLVVNPELEQEAVSQLASFFDVPLHLAAVENITTIGSFLAHNGKLGLVSPGFSDEYKLTLEKQLGLQLTFGTVNMGSEQVSSGIVINSKGFLIGDISGGPEVVNADQAFGFIEG